MHHKERYFTILDNNFNKNLKYKNINFKNLGRPIETLKKPKTGPSPNIFDQIPIEIFRKIFMQFTPEEIGNKLFLINKELNKKSKNNLFWREKFEIHFPHVLIKIKNENPKINLNEIDWCNEFIFTYKNQYFFKDQKIKRKFSFIKEGHPFSKQDLLTLTCDLYEKDREEKSILDWIQEINIPQQLDTIYNHRQNDLSDGAIEYGTGRSLFYWALNCKRSLAEIETLIAHGFSINSKCDNELTPIHIAAKLGRLDLVTLFLSKNNHLLNAVDGMGLTPLMYAASNGHLDVVNALLKMDDIHIYMFANGRFSEKYTGRNALHLASQNGHAQVIELLLKAGANATVPVLYNGINFLPIHLAARAQSEGAFNSVKVLCEKTPGLIDFPDACGQTPLVLAASRGNYKVVEYLSAKSNVNLNAAISSFMCEHYDKTPLHWAAQGGYSEIVRLLLERGADATRPFGELASLPLHLAIASFDKNTSTAKQNAYFNTVKAFIDHDPQLINAKNIQGSTPLIFAVLTKNMRLVEYLVSKIGLIDLDAEICNPCNKKQNGKTALHLAATMGESEIVRVLLRHGAKCAPEKSIIKSELTKQVQDIFECHENMLKRTTVAVTNSPFSFFKSSFGVTKNNTPNLADNLTVNVSLKKSHRH